MALKGNLRDFTTAQLLNLVNLARKTGVLRVSGREQAIISFDQGRLVYAETDVMRGDLGQVLYRAGKLSKKQATLIDEKLKGQSDRHLGHRLIKSKMISQADILESIRQHILHVVYGLFSWADGTFDFEADPEPASSRIRIPIELDTIIVEGSRRLEEGERLNGELPDLNIRLQFVARPENRLGKMNLTSDEWRIINYISPKNTIKQIAEANQLSDFEVRRTIYGLIEAGLIEPIREESDPRPTTRRKVSPQNRKPEASISDKKGVVNRLIDRIRSL
ncbi:MAG: DUF4388 domain-containing protein [Chloroflexota bacterium]